MLLVIVVLFIGCGGSLNEQFVKAVHSNWNVMGPDYKIYIEKDSGLTEGSKKRRLAAIDEFTKLVNEAKAKVDE